VRPTLWHVRPHAAREASARHCVLPFAGWCFVVAFVAEVGGVGLIIAEAIRMRRLMQRWHDFNPKRNAAGSYRQITIVNKVMQILITARYRVAGAVGLLLVGIAAGTLGNFASL
jgi:hypothetical protein